MRIKIDREVLRRVAIYFLREQKDSDEVVFYKGKTKYTRKDAYVSVVEDDGMCDEFLEYFCEDGYAW